MADNHNHHIPASEEEKSRLQKLERIKEAGINPYPDKYPKNNDIKDLVDLEDGIEVQTAGRIVLSRDMGKLCFAHIQDFGAKIQIALKVDTIGKDKYKFFVKNTDLGDFVGVKGEMFTTKKGEKTVLVEEYTILSKTLKPMPSKWHGLEDQELKYRHRYLDMIANKETRDRFKFRSDFIKLLRQFYWSQGFDEIETPILTNSASGALAKPFKTHHNALDLDVFLRIAPETYLKEATIGGYEKVFEIGRVFRNEGMDASHLQDFTMVEHYAAYWNFEDNMRFTEKVFEHILMNLKGSMTVEILGRDGSTKVIDFTPPWNVVTFRDLILNDIGIDIDNYLDVVSLRGAIQEKNIEIDNIDILGRGNLIDELYKKVSRPHLIEPTFVISHPLDVSPLARRNDENGHIVDRFQLVVNTWEIVNAYSEIVDPIDQASRFESQSEAKEAGDEDAHGKDDEYVDAMKYGMPPMSGWGMGIDRVVALLTQQHNLRDVVLFPLMRPEGNEGEGVE